MICECDGHIVHKLSQWRLTADWLVPRESDCSRTHSKVSSEWMPSYIKAMWPVLEIFKTDGYFPESRCILIIFNLILLFYQYVLVTLMTTIRVSCNKNIIIIQTIVQNCMIEPLHIKIKKFYHMTNINGCVLPWAMSVVPQSRMWNLTETEATSTPLPPSVSVSLWLRDEA